MNCVLKVEGLSKLYKERAAVDGLSFCVNEGEIVGFIGSNGAGKSTTIKLITGLIKPSSGNIYICGNDIKNREKALANIGAVVEEPHFYGYLTAKQNLEYFAAYFGNIDKNRIEEVLKLVGLFDRKNDKVSKYSVGMKQRLGIAVAILNKPKLLILDETTNGLDAEGIVEVRHILQELAHKEKVAIFISSHILSELQNLCDRFIIIDNGKLKKEFSKNSVETKTNTINTFIHVSDVDKASKILLDKFKIKCKRKESKLYFFVAKEERSKIVDMLTKSGIEVYGIGNVKTVLEKQFLSTIKKGK